ncbi:MAG: type I DNA topoisomerase [bacterium]
MSKTLVIVESPSKAKTINKYLGKNYIVEASIGHLRNLPKTQLGVDIENGFKPNFLNIRGKGDLIKKIKKLASQSEKILIATDPDREGEAIAQDIADIIEGNTTAEVYRILFNEITKSSVKKAITSTEKINIALVNSQRARRVMDRIIGYKISPFLWRAIIDHTSTNLSAGRVQSVALRLICEREEDINKFVISEYWSLWGNFETKSKDLFKAKLIEVNNKPIKILLKDLTELKKEEFRKKNFVIDNVNVANEVAAKILLKDSFIINDISKKDIKRHPYPPFITSTLQVEASRVLRLRSKKTMQIAQELYEGINLGKEGYVGLISYMRTDSTRLSDESLNAARSFILEKFGKDYLPEKPRNYEKKNKKNVQDAHEAIRPTTTDYSPEQIKQFLSPDQFDLYDLIWKRFIASQMESAIMETTTVNIKADEFLFRTTGSATKFDGFLRLYDESIEDVEVNTEKEEFPIPLGLEKNDKLLLNSLDKLQHFTKPPARFTESTLIKELEDKGIGRPSTYSMILSTIQDREYVVNENRKYAPTVLGNRVNGILVKNFPHILNVNFTAMMEDELDSIANGEIGYAEVLNDFYVPFAKALLKVESEIEKVKCEKCGSDMDIKIGRFGKYLACTNYPACKNIKSLKDTNKEPKPIEFTGDSCPKCGSKTIYRIGKFGKFIGCEKYPDCDFTEQIKTGIPCPKCGIGEVIPRRSKRGKTFYGCNKYPDCDYASWQNPAIKSKEVDENS